MVQKTKVSLLVALSVLAAAIGWSVAQLWPTWFGLGLPVSLGSAVAMFLVALSLLVWTLMTRSRLRPDAAERRMDPLVAARTAALAMAASRVGSLAFGFYLGVFLSNLVADYSSAGTDRIRISIITALFSFLTTVIALWLEKICRIKEPPANSDLRDSSPA